MNNIAFLDGMGIVEGYSTPKFAGLKGRTKMANRRRRSSKKSAQRNRFKSAAKACKGKSLRAFRACMKAKLKK